MLRKMSFAIIGGDLRNIKLADSLFSEGNSVYIYGFKKASFDVNHKETECIQEAVMRSEVVIGPLPCSNDNETINTPFHDGKILINELFKAMSKKQLFIAGHISEKVANLAQVYNVYCIDILEREEMAVLNAIPTAEGAIQIAMEEMPITLHSCNALIMGFGRIGKILAGMLQGIGSQVYVEARKYADLAWIKSYGYKPVYLDDLAGCLPKMDVIFNTIPSIVLNANMLSIIKSDCLIIDLASKPGGVDFAKAGEIGLKTIWALSLPGKVAPVTAARYIHETISNIIDELGV